MSDLPFASLLYPLETTSSIQTLVSLIVEATFQLPWSMERRLQPSLLVER
jgi:hypothetical protein